MITKRDKEILCFIEKYHSITPTQCSKIFFIRNKFAYDQARRRLINLSKEKLVKRYRKDMTSEVFYYMGEKPLSIHDSKVIDVMAEATVTGAKIKNFERNFKVNDYIVDGLIECTYKGYFYPFIIEVDYSHNTKLKRLDDIFSSGFFQSRYKKMPENKTEQDIFPGVIIVKPYASIVPLKSNSYDIHCLDFKLQDFKNIFL